MMGHYASEMGYSSRRDVSWLKWGFKGINFTDNLCCPLCFASIPESVINMGGTTDDYRLPWMEHIFWHEESNKDRKFAFYWNFPLSKSVTDRREAYMLGEMKRAYKQHKTLPAQFLEEWRQK
jgi:hypothetical protein